MSLTISVPSKAYNGGIIDVDGEYDFGSLWITPDVRVTVYVDGNMAKSVYYSDSKKHTFNFQVQAPKAPSTSAKIKVVAEVRSATDRGESDDATKIVELVQPGPNGASVHHFAGDADVSTSKTKWFALAAVVGAAALILLVLRRLRK